MKASIEALLKSADQFAEEAESNGKVTLTSKSNAMRRSAKEKEGELKSIEEAIDKKLEALKNQFLYHEIVISHTNGKNPRTLLKKCTVKNSFEN